MTAGRPTKYNPLYHPKMAFKLALLGAIDKELADIFEISESTLNLWKSEHSKFSESIKRGKLTADAQVAGRLFQKACGYSQKETKVFQYEGEPIIVPVVKHYGPDTAASIFWLKNRQPAKWRDKVDLTHATDPDNPPVLTVNFIEPDRKKDG